MHSAQMAQQKHRFSQEKANLYGYPPKGDDISLISSDVTTNMYVYNSYKSTNQYTQVDLQFIIVPHVSTLACHTWHSWIVCANGEGGCVWAHMLSSCIFFSCVAFNLKLLHIYFKYLCVLYDKVHLRAIRRARVKSRSQPRKSEMRNICSCEIYTDIYGTLFYHDKLSEKEEFKGKVTLYFF